jgi:hypothetical protein
MEYVMTIWYGCSSVLLGVLLFFPVKKLILALNVNRRQSRMQREITAEELAALQKRVIVIAAFIAVTFAFLYNKLVLLRFFASS